MPKKKAAKKTEVPVPAPVEEQPPIGTPLGLVLVGIKDDLVGYLGQMSQGMLQISTEEFEGRKSAAKIVEERIVALDKALELIPEDKLDEFIDKGPDVPA